MGVGGGSARDADCADRVVASRMCAMCQSHRLHTSNIYTCLTICHFHFCKLTKRRVTPKDWGAPGMLAWMCAAPPLGSLWPLRSTADAQSPPGVDRSVSQRACLVTGGVEKVKSHHAPLFSWRFSGSSVWHYTDSSLT